MKTSSIVTELKKWKFMIDQQSYAYDHGWAGSEYDHSKWMDVESYRAWDTYEEAMRNYEDCGWYYTTFRASSNRKNRYTLHFDGVGGCAKVYLNGKYVGGTENRYLPFDVDLNVNYGEENAVAVMVDNRFLGIDHLPGGKDVEWVLWGGLTHHVYVLEHPACYLSHMDIRADANGDLRVRTEIRNMSGQAFEGMLQICVDGLKECASSIKVCCKAGQSAFAELKMKANNPKLWSCDEPNLYTVCADLIRDGKTVFSASDRTGFRTLEVKGTSFFLNGKEIIFKGANRYDEYAPYGICPPEYLIREDLTEMKRFGINLIRTHYPQDPIHYEIADEIGMIYMIEVVLNWWKPEPEQTLDDFPILKEEAVNCLDRTFYYHCNHPCWLIWSTSNECFHSTTACKQMFRMLAERMRKYDSARLITTVTCQPLLDSEELDYCDFLSTNYYKGVMASCEEEMTVGLKKMTETMNQAEKFYPNVPHVMTEFGCPCVRGLRTAGDGRLSETLSASYIFAACKIFSRNPNMRGLVVWCWADYFHHRTFIPRSPDSMHLHCAYGPYGVKTSDRHTKTEVYDALREIFRQFDGHHEI